VVAFCSGLDVDGDYLGRGSAPAGRREYAEDWGPSMRIFVFLERPWRLVYSSDCTSKHSGVSFFCSRLLP
jgi:hypothetical protein